MSNGTRRAADLRSIAELVAQVLVKFFCQHAIDFSPTITDNAVGDAFDAAMAAAQCPIRCWRGSRGGATVSQLQYRAQRYGLCPDCGMRKDMCREVGGCQPEVA